MWKADQAGQFNSAHNEVHVTRKNKVLNGKEFELKGRLYTDLTFQNRLLPNGVTARLTLTRSKTDFCLNAFENYHIHGKV